MHQQGIQGLGLLGQQAHGLGIDAPGQFRLLFRLIHRRVGSSIDDQAGPLLPHHRPYLIKIGQVASATIQGQHRSQGRQVPLQLPA